jgi:hypothetical protein
MPFNYDNIPEELRWMRQWYIAGPDEHGNFKSPHAKGRKGLFHVSPKDEQHGQDFETIVEFVSANSPCGLGFILRRGDGYTVIDLDVKNEVNYPNKVDHLGRPVKWTTEDELSRFHKIIEAFDSYTERSASGQGFHIWVEGTIPSRDGMGIKRDGVEVYCQERFIVCTGDVFLDRPIRRQQDLLDMLVTEIEAGQKQSQRFDLVEETEVKTDDEIFAEACSAENSEKFVSLCEGNIDGYPSQSEADLALMSMFAFYSKSNAQCRRMFRLTRLGQRSKANRNDVHLDRILRIIRSRQSLEEQAQEYAERMTAALVANLRPGAPVAPPPVRPAAQQSTPHSAPAPVPPVVAPAPVQTAPVAPQPIPYTQPLEVSHIPFPDEVEPEGDTFEYEETNRPAGIDWPPGMAGALARYIYNSSLRPVREVSIVATLGLLAGVCGKAFQIPQSGLNLYITLVARSAVGKEAMHSGIANVMNFVRDAVPNAMSFVDFAEYASGPALTKVTAANPSFVNVSGEWGRRLKRLAMEDGRDGPMQSLRTVMTNLYQKSASTSIVGGIGYSDQEKSVASVSGVAYSMIGETTPNTFYESLTDNMMEDGFLSRFTIIEYTGERPPENENPVMKADPILIEAVCALMAQAVTLNERFTVQQVLRSQAAHDMLRAFNLECDAEIHESGDDESRRQMWNRASLKASRIAALLAVADNHVNPVIQQNHAEWALDVIRRDIALMRRRINSGDVGVGDATREKKALSLIHRYLVSSLPPSYGIPERIRQDGIVPRKYLQLTTQRIASFTTHRNGQNLALDATLKSLVDSGYLVEVQKEKMLTQYNFSGRAFRVVSLPPNIGEKKSSAKRQ